MSRIFYIERVWGWADPHNSSESAPRTLATAVSDRFSAESEELC